MRSGGVAGRLCHRDGAVKKMVVRLWVVGIIIYNLRKMVHVANVTQWPMAWEALKITSMFRPDEVHDAQPIYTRTRAHDRLHYGISRQV